MDPNSTCGRPVDGIPEGYEQAYVFDRLWDPQLAAEFIIDLRHHIAVACDAGKVVGFASAIHCVHSDKTPELWVNVIGIAPSHQRRGLAKQLLRALFDDGRAARGWRSRVGPAGPLRADMPAL